MNNRMKKLIAALVLLAAGVICFVFGATSSKELKEYRQVTAVVTEIQRELIPDSDGGNTEQMKIFVTYSVGGKEYTEELQNTKTNMKQGDAITVLYNPSDPTQVSGATKGIAVIQYALGAVLTLAGLGTAAFALLKSR